MKPGPTRVRFHGLLIGEEEERRALETACDEPSSRGAGGFAWSGMAPASVLLPRPWWPRLHNGEVDLVPASAVHRLSHSEAAVLFPPALSNFRGAPDSSP